MLSLLPPSSTPSRPSAALPRSSLFSLKKASPPPEAGKTGNDGFSFVVENGTTFKNGFTAAADGFTVGNGFTFVVENVFTSVVVKNGSTFVVAVENGLTFVVVENGSASVGSATAAVAAAAAATAAAAAAGAAATPLAEAFASAKLGGMLPERNSSAKTTPRGAEIDDSCPRGDDAAAHTTGEATE